MSQMISSREAAEVLSLRGIEDGRGRTWARGMGRRVLESGLAGKPLRTAGGHFFAADRIHELADWRTADLTDLPSPADEAFLLIRSASTATSRDWATLSNAGIVAAAEISIALRRLGFLPVVVTTCGYVVGGAEVTDAHLLGPSRIHLELRPAGSWFGSFHRCVLHTTAGNHWQIRYPRVKGPGDSGWLGWT